MHRAGRRGVKTMLRISLLVLLGVLLSEAVLRLPIPGVGYDLPRARDPVLNHRWLPNARFTLYWYEALGVPAYERVTNSESWFLGRDLTKRKQPDEYRIFFVGDSFVEGICPQAETMPALVEKRLAQSAAARIEVVNAGTFSYSPLLYYLLIKTKVLAYAPDVVLINVAMNDVFDDFVYEKSLERDERGEPIACGAGGAFAREYVRTTDYIRRKSRAERILAALEDYSRVARILNVRLFDLMNSKIGPAPGMPLPGDWCREPWSEQTVASTRFSMDMLRSAVRLLKTHGVKVVLSAVPLREQFEGKLSTKPLEAIRAIAQEEQAPFFDAYAALQRIFAHRAPAAFYIPGDMHFNTRGNAAWAEAYDDFLAAEVLPPPAQGSDPAR